MSNEKDIFGFLTVVEHARYGVFGGYLLLNEAGRPLEFHCTAPIRPNRAQEILYGITLRPYLYGEQIGQALLAKSKATPSVLCTDCRPALAVRSFTDVPAVLVLRPEAADPLDEQSEEAQSDEIITARHIADADETVARDIDPADDGGERLAAFSLGANRLAVPKSNESMRPQIEASLRKMAETLNLSEPFQRIREAITEARRAG